MFTLPPIAIRVNHLAVTNVALGDPSRYSQGQGFSDHRCCAGMVAGVERLPWSLGGLVVKGGHGCSSGT